MHLRVRWLLVFGGLACGPELIDPETTTCQMCTKNGDASTTDSSEFDPVCLDKTDLEYDVRVEGRDLQDYEGMKVEVVTVMPLAFTPGEQCRALGTTQVSKGTFVLELTNRTDGGAYPLVAVLIDVDDDGLCSAGIDATWSVWSAVQPGSAVVESIEPTELAVADAGACSSFE